MADDLPIEWVSDPRYPNHRVTWIKIEPGVCWHCGASFQEKKALEQRLALAEAKLRQIGEIMNASDTEETSNN